MNYYFLVEDEKSFYNLLPYWLDYLDFGCKRVPTINDVVKNNYILESGQGVFQLETKALFRTIDTILDKEGIIDNLVVIVDAEDIGASNRRERILKQIEKQYLNCGILIPCSINVFVCNICLETWLLGCYGIYPNSKSNIKPILRSYCDFYNIEENDPEYMTKPLSVNNSVASYHFQYFHALTQQIATERHKSSLIYRKRNLGCTCYKEYFDGMIERINRTEDLLSFKDFYNFIITESKNNK